MRGNLIYLMGPSGVGKDSLIAYARARLEPDRPIVFAHRYVTRPTQAGHQNSVSLSAVEFDLRRCHSLFLFDWAAHGCRYAGGIEIGLWLERGLTTVINGSRAYLATAQKRLPELMHAYVHAPPDILRQRLIDRGRESEADIRRRLERMRDYKVPPGTFVIKNDSSLEDAGQQFLCLLRQVAGSPKGRASNAARNNRI